MPRKQAGNEKGDSWPCRQDPVLESVVAVCVLTCTYVYKAATGVSHRIPYAIRIVSCVKSRIGFYMGLFADMPLERLEVHDSAAARFVVIAAAAWRTSGLCRELLMTN